MIRKIDHVVITTANWKRCIAFYEKIGFSARDGGGRYELFAGDFKINVHQKGAELQPHAAFVQCGSADLCFELDCDVDRFAVEMRKQGLQTEVGVVSRTGARGTMRSVYLRDPDGNLLEFSSYE